MRALVVYESIYGNTRAIAFAIGEGIAARMPVEIVDVADAPVSLPGDVTLVVAGGPTHGHGMPTPSSRADAIRRSEGRSAWSEIGIREWLDGVGLAREGVAAAAFDTRIKGPALIWGSAARPIAGRLREHGYALADEPQSFLVGGPTGSPFDRIIPGEIDRARAWGAHLAGRVRQPAMVR